MLSHSAKFFMTVRSYYLALCQIFFIMWQLHHPDGLITLEKKFPNVQGREKSGEVNVGLLIDSLVIEHLWSPLCFVKKFTKQNFSEHICSWRLWPKEKENLNLHCYSEEREWKKKKREERRSLVSFTVTHWSNVCSQPNMYRLMQLSNTPLPHATMFTNLFYRQRNRVEFISDFPPSNEAEVIHSLQVHPQGWCVLSRNTSMEDSSEVSNLNRLCAFI